MAQIGPFPGQPTGPSTRHTNAVTSNIGRMPTAQGGGVAYNAILNRRLVALAAGEEGASSRQIEICGLEALRAGRPPARATTWLSA